MAQSPLAQHAPTIPQHDLNQRLAASAIRMPARCYAALDAALRIIDERLADDCGCADYSRDPELGVAHRQLLLAAIIPFDIPENQPLMRLLSDNFKGVQA